MKWTVIHAIGNSNKGGETKEGEGGGGGETKEGGEGDETKEGGGGDGGETKEGGGEDETRGDEWSETPNRNMDAQTQISSWNEKRYYAERNKQVGKETRC